MATLTSTKIKNTYDALLKSIDNDAIGTTAKQITDGLGNVTPLYISTTQVGIGVTPEAGLNLHVFGDAKIGSNLTVIGNLVVEGSTTTVGTDTLTVKDPLIVLANNNTSTDAVDIGFYGKYTPSGTTLYSGLFREALTGKYRLFKGLEDEPTTTVNTSGTGYAVATLIGDLEGTLTGVIASTTTATTQSANDNSTKVATTAYVDNQVGLYDTLSEVLANGNTTGGTDIAITAGDDIVFGSTSKAIWSNALEIYRDGNDAYLKALNGSLSLINNDNGTEKTVIKVNSNTAELYYNDVEKLQTTNTGVDITGNIDFTGNINIGDNQKILFGDSGDVEMFFNGSTFVIDDTVEVFGFDIDTNLIRFRGTDLYTEISNAQHTFWTNGTERFKINATEVKVSHQLNVTGDLIVDTDTLFVDASEDSVGIGLTNPSDYSADELVISVPDDSGMTLVSGTTDTAYITFADGTAAADQANFISHDHNTNTLTVFSQAKVSIGILEAEVAYFTDTAFYVDKSTTIDDTLTVNGNSTFAGDVTVNNSGDGKITIGGTSGLEIIHNNAGNTIAEIKQLYASTSNSAQMKLTSGFTTFHTGTSGTERMRIDSSGVVQVRNTEPTIQLYNTDTSLVANQLIGTVDFYKSDGSGAGAGVSASIQVRSDSSIGAKSYMAFHTDNGTGSQNAERMRIDSSGSLIVGTATVAAANAAADNFVIKGGGTAVGLTISQDSNSGTGTIFFGDVASSSAAGFRYNHNTGDMAVSFEDDITFSNNGGERMRITSGGDIQVTGGSFYNSVSGITIIGNSDEFEFVDSLASGTKRFRPGVDNSFDLGDSSRRWDDVWATNPAIQTSDRNEKNTIKETDLGLDFINKLKPVSYIWNNKTRTHYGLIAQDVQEVLKDISKDTKDFAGFIKADVSEEKDNTKHSYGLRYNEFISPMIKAIQELKAEIETLKAQINN